MESKEERMINILVSTFGGLSLPRTLALAVPESTTISQVYQTVLSRLPSSKNARYILTTPDHSDISASPSSPIHTLLSSKNDTLLTLRLSIPLCGGKGGFGSQLRAAGGRMSKRRKNDGNEHASSRNLDGRRLRTVAEAKALAEYLAIKPEMDKRTKEERRARWASIVESSERRQDEIRSEGRNGKGRVSEQWLEDKEEAATRTREAVLKAMRSGDYVDGEEDTASGEVVGEDAEEMEEEEGAAAENKSRPSIPQVRTQKYVGFDDEDDEFMSDDSEDDGTSDSRSSVEETPSTQGKGKASEEEVQSL